MDYCISDIHGCSKTLLALLEQLPIKKHDTIYFLGDYIDRGHDSKGVLDIVMAMPNAVCLKGNHEDFLMQSQSDEGVIPLWMMNGGWIALDSFGGKVAEKYIAFISAMPLIVALSDFYLCHSGGIKYDAPMTTPSDILLWDRGCPINAEQIGKRVICGHTPTPLEIIKDDLWRDKQIIDAGCVFAGQEPYGNLVALRLDDMKLFEQPNIEPA